MSDASPHATGELSMIKQCTVVLTRHCNLRCDFCYVKRAGYSQADRIDYADLQRVVDFCCDAGVKFIFFTGGEPLLYPQILEILQYINSKKQSHNIQAAIASNGVVLKNQSFCQKLVDSGLDYLDISMKGFGSQDWKQATGYDGAEQQLQAIRNVAALNLNFTCSMVVTSASVQTLCEAVQQAQENGARQFSFTFVIDNEPSKTKDLVYLQEHSPFKLIDSFLAQRDRLDAITTDWWIEYSLPLCAYTEEQLALLKGKMSSPCQIHHNNAITFNTKLELLPCDMYLEHPFGQLGKDFSTYQEFKEFIVQSGYSDFMNTLRQMPAAECADCLHLQACRGGCPVLWKNYSFSSLKALRESSKLHWIQEK